MKSLSLLVGFLIAVPAWALTHSTPEEGMRFQASVQLRVDAPDSHGDLLPGFCNGALLSPTVLVTAAHCVRDNIIANEREAEVTVGSYRYSTRPNGEVVRIGYAHEFILRGTADFYVTPELRERLRRQGYSTQIGPNEDFAVVVLEEALPVKPDFTFAQLASASELSRVTASLRSYEPTVVTINPFEEMSLDTKRSAILDVLNWNGSHFEGKPSSRVQEGDSGSPLFAKVDGQWRLIGVVKGEAHNFFSSWDVYSSVKAACAIARQLPNAEQRSVVCR